MIQSAVVPGTAVTITQESPLSSDLDVLFQRHALAMYEDTPPESIHMLPREDLARPEIAFLVLRDAGPRGRDLVDGEAHPELGGLVLDDEQHLVVGVGEGGLGGEDQVEAEVVAVGHAPGEVGLRAFDAGVVGVGHVRSRKRWIPFSAVCTW